MHHFSPSIILAESRCISARLMSAVAQRFVGLFVGLLNAGLVRIYQYVVDPAPPDSLPNKLFTLLAAGPLRSATWKLNLSLNCTVTILRRFTWR